MIALYWFRRDLRLTDNAALFHALKSGLPVQPVFIFDRNILDRLSDKQDARVTFIHQRIVALQTELQALGSSLRVFYGTPETVFAKLLTEGSIGAVYANRDYEPYALRRDAQIEAMLAEKGVSFQTFKDHVIFEKDEVLKDDGLPYTVFTPYSRKWRAALQKAGGSSPEQSFFLKAYPTEGYFGNFRQTPPGAIPSLAEMGFAPSKIEFPTSSVSQGLIKEYENARNYPAKAGTSRLGIHFRFGTISIREKARKAMTLSDTFVNELIWRDFYSQILAHFPYVAEGPFKQSYARIPWRNAPEDLALWQAGQTGYPIVDAGMRELATTGFMHNRVRMITASFLCKHLLINWQEGEAWFAQKLLDFDLASNNGGWQWAAGCGTDAAPYFRIFNPGEQAKKFDSNLAYIRKWVPEFGTAAYPKPMEEHTFARERCLATFKQYL